MRPHQLRSGAIALFAVAAVFTAVGCSSSSSSGSGTAASTGSGGSGTSYPVRSISYISPFPPGGGTDLIARLQQPYLEKTLGQSVVIDNVSGGSGAVGWAQAAHATADGYTMTVFALPNIVVQPLAGSVGYTTSQLDPVAISASQPLVLAVPLSSPYKTLAQFLAAAKASPGKLTIGGSGSLTSVDLAMLTLERAANVRLQYVSYDGGAEQVAAFLGDHVSAVIFNASDILPYVSKARILGVSTASTSPIFPSAPTFESQGVDLVQQTAYGVAVPDGTPQSVVTALQNAFLKTNDNSAFQSAALKVGDVTTSMDHAQAAAEITKEISTYTSLINWARSNGQLQS